MPFLEGALIALDALWANKLRPFLTLLGNIVGVMSVIAVVSIIDGMNSYIRTEVAHEGSGVFRVQRVNELDILSDYDKFLRSLHNPRITPEDVAFLRTRVPLAEALDANRSATAEVRRDRRYIRGVAIQGRSEAYPLVGKWDLADGRHLSRHEVEHGRAVAVLGAEVAERLYPGVDPVGKTIKVGGINHDVVGVLARRAGILVGDPNLTLVIPLSSFERLFGTHRSLTVSVKAAELERVPECVDQTRLAMRIRRHLGPGREDNFALVTSDNLLKLWGSISRGVFAALVGIVSISLVVGGVVIMNIMLVSVTERTREIGVRKALGATRGNILWQFLVESVTLSTCGGVLGIVAGFATAAVVAYFSPLPYAIKLWSVVVGLVVTFAVGVFFGIYPALQAARLDPIEALRYE